VDRQGLLASPWGQHPQPRRIFQLSFRCHGVDLEAEVGKPDPFARGTVLAIFDLGRGSPYLIHSSSRGGSVRETLVAKPVYEVIEFTN
jgi:hypothetical protein